MLQRRPIETRAASCRNTMPRASRQKPTGGQSGRPQKIPSRYPVHHVGNYTTTRYPHDIRFAYYLSAFCESFFDIISGMRNSTPLVIVLANRIQANAEMLAGVADYAHRFGPWNIHPIEVGQWERESWKWEGWHADGLILGNAIPDEVARRIRRAKLPTVLLQITRAMHRKSYPLADAPRCHYDSAACGRLAAQHLLELGHRNFAFVDHPDAGIFWSRDRERSFRAELTGQAGRIRYFRYGSASEAEQANWMLERPRMTEWLQRLPKPCAVFAANDRRAIQVAESCRFGNISVPDQVSILGADNDAWFCDAATPTLSSIRFNTREAGFGIARKLAEMMNGIPHAGETATVSPIDVVTRQSTDWFAVKDAKVALALQHIHNDFANPRFSIARLARLTGLARRTLELRFRNVTGRTLHEEIEHTRISRITTLLRERPRTRKDLLDASGYRSLSALDRAMRRLLPAQKECFSLRFHQTG